VIEYNLCAHAGDMIEFLFILSYRDEMGINVTNESRQIGYY
jgi:hypothetical protein